VTIDRVRVRAGGEAVSAGRLEAELGPELARRLQARLAREGPTEAGRRGGRGGHGELAETVAREVADEVFSRLDRRTR
jgi:hypothetical protein